MGDGNGSKNGGQKWLQPVLLSILVPGVVALVTVVSMATKYGARLDQLENNAESRWTALAARLDGDEDNIRQHRVFYERMDQRIASMQEAQRNRLMATDQRAQDYGRQLQDLRTDLQRLQITIAGVESMLGYTTGGPQQRRHR